MVIFQSKHLCFRYFLLLRSSSTALFQPDLGSAFPYHSGVPFPPTLARCLCIASSWNNTHWSENTTLQHKYCTYFTASFLLFSFLPFSYFTFLIFYPPWWTFFAFTLASSSSGPNSNWGLSCRAQTAVGGRACFASECKGDGLHMTKNFLMLCTCWKGVNSCCCCTGVSQWELMIPI